MVASFMRVAADGEGMEREAIPVPTGPVETW
jgi:hypothetical protein